MGGKGRDGRGAEVADKRQDAAECGAGEAGASTGWGEGGVNRAYISFMRGGAGELGAHCPGAGVAANESRASLPTVTRSAGLWARGAGRCAALRSRAHSLGWG